MLLSTYGWHNNLLTSQSGAAAPQQGPSSFGQSADKRERERNKQAGKESGGGRAEEGAAKFSALEGKYIAFIMDDG